MLRLLLKSNLYKSETGGISDTAELENAELHLFYLVQTEPFPTEKSNLFSSSPRHFEVNLKSRSFLPLSDQVVL